MTDLRLVVVALVAATVLPGGAAPLAAQPSDAAARAGWLQGRVLEVSSGDPIPGAELVLDGPVRRTALSRPDGGWRVGPLPPGSYTVRVEHLGYAPWSESVEVRSDGEGALPVHLTPRPLALDALVVTAGRRTQRLADVAVATELVTAREIQETGSTDLASVLTERTGLELQGGHPAGAGVMIQGMGSERVLILLDNQPFIGRISGNIDVSRIPTAMIERVEVVRGPQSTLYGSEAMGGVVNVITRAPVAGAWSTAAVATAGDQGRRDVSVSALGGVGPVRGVVDVGRRAIELAPGRPGEGGGALSERWDGRARLGWDAPVEGLRLEVAGLLLDERQSWRSGQLGHFADNTQWTGRLTGTLDRGRHAVSATFFATAFEHLSRRARGAEPLPGTGQVETQALMEGELIWGMELGDHALDAGVELTRETIDSERVLGGRRTERTAEPFVQTTLNWGGVSVVPGIRGSWSNLWGGQWTPRLAALWRPRPELGLRASVGQGFRAPSFKELSMQFLNVGPGFGYAVRGNADLRPELSRNATVSVEWAGDRSWVRVQGYENQFDDFIETQMVGDSSGVEVYSYGNIDNGFTRGLELEAGGRLGAWNLEGGLNLLRAEQRETGEALLGRPSRSGRGTLGWASMDGLRLSVTGVWTGRTPIRRNEERTDYRPDFLRFDARAAWRLPGGLELVLGVDNLLDERLEEWPGFTGRHLYTSVAWRAAGGG